MKKKIIAICSMVVVLVMCFAVNALAYDSVIGHKPFVNDDGKLTILLWGQIHNWVKSSDEPAKDCIFDSAEVTFTVPKTDNYSINTVSMGSPYNISNKFFVNCTLYEIVDGQEVKIYSSNAGNGFSQNSSAPRTLSSGAIPLYVGKTYKYVNKNDDKPCSVKLNSSGSFSFGMDVVLVGYSDYDGPPLEEIDPPVTDGTVVDPGNPDDEGSSAPGTSVLDKIAAAISGLESVSANFVAFLSSFLSWIPAEVKAVILGGVSMIVLLGVVKFVRG